MTAKYKNAAEYRQAAVYVQGNKAGVLSETENGYEFEYLKEYLSRENPLAVSLTLPLSEKPYKSTTLFPFFDGLIPEGWLLATVSKNWKIALNDRFGFLMTVCRDCVGDVYLIGEE